MYTHPGNSVSWKSMTNTTNTLLQLITDGIDFQRQSSSSHAASTGSIAMLAFVALPLGTQQACAEKPKLYNTSSFLFCISHKGSHPHRKWNQPLTMVGY